MKGKTTNLMTLASAALLLAVAMPAQADFSVSASASVSCDAPSDGGVLYSTKGSASGKAEGESTDVGASYSASAFVNAGSAKASQSDSGSWPAKNSAQASVPEISGVAFKDEKVSAMGSGSASSPTDDGKSHTHEVNRNCGDDEPGGGGGGGDSCLARVVAFQAGSVNLITVPGACSVLTVGDNVQFFDVDRNFMFEAALVAA